MNKQEQIDATVALVAELAPSATRAPWLEPYQLTSELEERRVLARDTEEASPVSTARERARKRQHGRTRRLLVAAVEQGKLVRHLTRDGPAPHADGSFRPLYAGATGYTTPELEAAAERAVAEWRSRQAEQDALMRELLAQARAYGLPDPVMHDRFRVEYDIAGLQALIELAKWKPRAQEVD